MNCISKLGLFGFRSKADFQSFFLFTCGLSVLTISMVVYSNFGNMEVSDVSAPPLTLKSIAESLSKPNYMARLSQEQQRKLASQIHYVSEIIKKDGKDIDASEKRLASTIVMESLKANYDPLFVAAVIKAESRFNRHAVSVSGAQGLMQILPTTGRYISDRRGFNWKGGGNLADPEYNVKLGIAYLRYLETYFGKNQQNILIAYNWGPANLMEAMNGKRSVPNSPIIYAKTILSTHARWRRDFDSRRVEYRNFNYNTYLS